jgi:subtilase family serine protease
VAVGPDLVVTTLMAPAQAAAGTSILVSDVTNNQGGGAADASATRFYLSVNILLDPSDTPLDARAVGALAPGTSSTATTSVAIPANMPAGSYYLFAHADASGQIVEPNEANNSRVTPIRIGADLIVSALTAPARTAAGAVISVGHTTRNSGSGAAAGSLTAFYLSSNLLLDAADIRVQPAHQVPPLAANEGHSATTVLTVPDVAAGAWYLLAAADDGNAVAETIETNNLRFTGIQIGPDLTLVGLNAPGSGVAGGSITITDTVRNAGAADAGASTIRYYLSANFMLDAGDTPLNAARAVPLLAPNTSNTGSMSVPLPPGMTGTFFLIVVADGNHAVAESSEANNTVARVIQIGSGTTP